MPNGIHAKFLGEHHGHDFRSRYGIQGPFVLSVGRVDEMKGFHFVIRALHQVPGIHYVIAGPPGDFHGSVVRLIQKEGLQDRVTLVGSLSEDEVLSALDACDAYIQPSLFEASPVSTLEALARGKACVGSNAGGLSSLLDGCGILFEAGNVQEISRCLQRLRDDQALRQRLGDAGRLKAAALTWDRIIPFYEETLLKLTRPDSDGETLAFPVPNEKGTTVT